MTAGRFYNDERKRKIFSLACEANLLKEDEKEALGKVIFSDEMEEYQTPLDCSNGLLFEIVETKAYRKEILLCRKETLLQLLNRLPWTSKATWLRFIHTDVDDYRHRFENAVFSYSANDGKKAAEKLEHYAEMCDPDSLLICSAVYREEGEYEKEGVLLMLYNRLMDDLFMEEVPEAFAERARELGEKYSLADVNEIDLRYFDELKDAKRQIGFRY